MLKIISVSAFIVLLTACVENHKDLVSVGKQIDYHDIQTHQSIHLSKIEKAIDLTIHAIKNGTLSTKNCSVFINKKASFLLYHGEEEYLSKSQLKLIKQRSYIIVKKLFNMRLLLRDHLVKFSNNNNITDSCLTSFRKAFRYSRFLEEFITEIGVSQYPDRRKAIQSDFSQNAYQFYLNPKYDKFQLKTGDILLLRATSFVSATIARIGDDDGQFSHAALVYVDKNNKVMILEALISEGLVSTPYKKWRKDNHNARIIQFRAYNQKKAAKLAKKFYEESRKYHNNKSLVYDFQMDEKTKNQLFCSEVIQHTFANIGIPTYKTSFSSFKNHNFLENLTIVTPTAFAPSDIEIEPKVELISEWRNYDITNQTRIQDAILTSILRWMVNDNYKLNDTIRSIIGTNVGYYGRHIFGLNSNTIPTNMPYSFLKTIIQLNDLHNILETYILKLNEQHIKTFGYPITYKKMIIELEKLKTIDYKNYQLHKKSEIIFHDLFSK